ncbi:late secretory pathway protein AVL9 homolog isoform X2 [Mya arenaria]|uniref:late secretory pathway protein AVL9 homolog isoform X2 n=1 Tax=Mya arenaria TaxID=6604 RepID=UPI0022E49ACD|nr:late secretory pathway protein AVL9 homolog isoform X2 [Mya arenaria]
MTTFKLGSSKPVLHIVVIGFHHKKGCQVDYAFPPLIPGGAVHSSEAPPEWKHLPSLAIPDGAHNYTKDSIYFHLPGKDGSDKTVYGVACYRQIDTKDLKIKTDDITRSTVQKSVCVLSNLPLYGLIEAKLELITHAYFQELDFSQVSLLEETYNNLNASLTESLLDGGSQVYLGMDVKELVQMFRHKVVMLFKLVLLERRVLVTGAPVERLGNTLMSLLSLFPGMIEHGLDESTSYGKHKSVSPTMKNVGLAEDSDDFLEIRYSGDKSPELSVISGGDTFPAVEPSSPTMDRGLDRPNFTLKDNHSKESLTSLNHSSLTNNNSKVANTNNSDLKIHKAVKRRNSSEPSVSNSELGETLDYVDDYYTSDAKQRADTQFDKIGTEHANASDINESYSGDHQRIVLAEDSNLLTGVTSYEAVQKGKSIPKKGSVINIEEYSLEIAENHFGSLPKEILGQGQDGKEDVSSSLKQRSQTEESVEDLDSPESISKIDQEDCFSWEDDNLSLAINTDKGSLSLDESAGLASSFKDMPTLQRNLSEGSQGSGNGSSALDRTNSTGSQNEGKEVEEHREGQDQVGEGLSPGVKAAAIKSRLTNALSGLSLKQRLSRSKPGSRETSEPPSPVSSELPPLSQLHQDDMGFPLAVFTKGCVCYPYLSLQYFDLLSDVNIRGFLIGATNMLFRQKRHLTDVIIDVTDNKIEMHDRELQRHLVLTTADLRFADILVKAVTGSGDDGYFEGTEWEGNDEWLRAQFRLYLEALIATINTDDAKLLEDFGGSFVQCWKTTHNYRVLASTERPGLTGEQAGHPCQGNLSMADIKVRLAHTMHNTEGGKKINAAVSQTGKYVVQTGKAVGGALTQAKSSLPSMYI